MNIDVRPNLAAGLSTQEAGIQYLSGFGNGFETEALPGALPIGRNSPQKCPYGLYAEQLTRLAVHRAATTNERSWLYRIRPTVSHWGRFREGRHRPLAHGAGRWRRRCRSRRMRWDPIPIPDETLSFVEGVRTITTAGDAGTQAGMGAHVYLDHPVHGGRVFLQRRRRDAVRAAARRAAVLDRVRHHRHRAGRDRRHPARREDPGRTHGRSRPAATCARTTAARSRCRSAGRSARTAWPIRATS